MQNITFALTAFSLLALPGPTNALLALSADQARLRDALARIAIVVAGYFAVVLPIAWLAGPFLHEHAGVARGVKLASAGWVLYLGLSLWTVSPTTTESIVENRRLLVTTLLNPKALIMGLTLVPTSAPSPSLASVAVLAGVVVVTSSIWLVAGRLIASSGGHRTIVIRKVGSIVLWIFSAALATSALS